jgi:DNA-binding MarR family transcriptional regulator
MDDSGFSFASYFAAADEQQFNPIMENRGSRKSTFPTDLVLFAKRIKAIRDSRTALLDPSLLGEPAWNILLALYISAGEQYPLTISALSAESGAPASTAARSIERLLKLKMVRRVPNPGDNRSTYIELTPGAAGKLTELLERAHSKYVAG